MTKSISVNTDGNSSKNSPFVCYIRLATTTYTPQMVSENYQNDPPAWVEDITAGQIAKNDQSVRARGTIARDDTQGDGKTEPTAQREGWREGKQERKQKAA